MGIDVGGGGHLNHLDHNRQEIVETVESLVDHGGFVGAECESDQTEHGYCRVGNVDDGQDGFGNCVVVFVPVAVSGSMDFE
jgi:hypothetical protein